MGKRVGAIVLAGGKGRRMNSGVQKQYMLLDGKPIVVHALMAFEESNVDDIILVTGEDDIAYAKEELIKAYGLKKVTKVVAGGKERYHSVFQGLCALEHCDYVLIHDGARPLVTKDIIERSIVGAMEYDACVVGMPVKDTIKISDGNNFASDTPDRKFLWQIQTPQSFSYELIFSAYKNILEDESAQVGITDDAMVVELQKNKKIKLLEGSYENLKVTTPEDLVIAESLLKARKNVVFEG